MSLEQRMKELLAQASVLAEASAAGLSERTSSGKAGTREPTIGGPSTYDLIVRRFSNARSHSQQLEAVEWAERLISQTKRQKPLEMSSKQREYWVLVNSQGRDYRDVAAEFGMRDTTVWKMRSDNGYEPRKGYPKVA